MLLSLMASSSENYAVGIASRCRLGISQNGVDNGLHLGGIREALAGFLAVHQGAVNGDLKFARHRARPLALHRQLDL